MSTRLAVAAVATALMVGPALPSAQVQSSPRAGSVEKAPVVYLLHGYGRDDTFNGRLAKLAGSADTLTASGGGFHEMIVVMPNAYSLHKGSMYSNSPTTGDWETFVARDLVTYVDGPVKDGQVRPEIVAKWVANATWRSRNRRRRGRRNE